VRDLIVAERPSTSVIGIVLTAASIVIMPTLAAAKRRVGLRMGSRLVIADAAETRLCAVLSVTTFLSLLLFLLLGWTWLDPVAAFVIAVFAVLEGREAWAGEHEEDED
jgi:divalent metal cation (Fe/Co/Zn/Cd) transporter